MNNLISFIENKDIGQYKENYSFKKLTSYRTGGDARLVLYPKDVSSLVMVLDYIKSNNISYKVFGNGSNILASDDFYDGVIIKLTNLNKMSVSDLIVEAEAGYNFSLLCNQMAKLGYSGLEFGGGIPAQVGGAVYMNAGAYLEDVSNCLIKVDILDENLNFRTLDKEELNFSYRHSIFMEKNWIILKAYFKLSVGDKDELVKITDERRKRRITTQPLEFPSAGSVFRNPEGMYAGKLIEECGLKGMTYGGAMISFKHANFIVNNENAKSYDIYYLMELAKKRVYDKFKVELYREQELFNWEK